MGGPYEYGYRNGRQLSHFLVDVTASGRELLAHALAIAFADIVDNRRERPATHVAEAGRALVFFDARFRKIHLERDDWALRELPAMIGSEEAVELAWQWLARADYGDDEHDGSCDRGFHVYNGQFGIVDRVWAAFIAVEPTYIYIPK